MTHCIVRLEMDALSMNKLIEIFDDAGPQRFGNLHDSDGWFFAGRNSIVLVSNGRTDHYARLTAELWSSAPPLADTAWGAPQERQIQLDSGELVVHPGSSRPTVQALGVGQAGEYHVRGYAKGQQEIWDQTPYPDMYALRGVERFLLQIWPAS